MSTAVHAESSVVRQPGVLKVWGMHLACFTMPLLTLAYLLTGPHRWWASLLWTSPIWISIYLDKRSKPEKRQPVPNLPLWPFDLVLYVLAALQLVNVGLLVWLGTKLDWSAAPGAAFAEVFAAHLLVGINSGYSGIVLAHELIHRREKHMQWLGRLMLVTVFYEHFYTEHVRGHHARVATPDDPATARFGETFRQFIWRTIPAQFRSAWRLECKRLGDRDMAWNDRRMLRHRVLHGVLAETALTVTIFAFFGVTAGVLFLLQATMAIRMLETVNYIEHWGLLRAEKKVRPVDSWDTDSRFTLYNLIGLSRHADHHAHAARPYPQLRYFEESPKMPYGYFGTVWMAIVHNQRFRELATEELKRRKLGPFREPVQQQPSAA